MGQEALLHLGGDLELALHTLLLDDLLLGRFQLPVGARQLFVRAPQVCDDLLVGFAQAGGDETQHLQGRRQAARQEGLERRLVKGQGAHLRQGVDGGKAGRVVQQGHLADDVAGAALGQGLRVGAGQVAGHGCLAGGDDVKVPAPVALLQEHVAGRERLLAGNLGQVREGLVADAAKGPS